MIFAAAAVARGEKAALFIFDEELGLLFERMKNMGIDLAALRDTGNLLIEQVDAAELSPANFRTGYAVAWTSAASRRWSSTVSTATRPPCPKRTR